MCGGALFRIFVRHQMYSGDNVFVEFCEVSLVINAKEGISKCGFLCGGFCGLDKPKPQVYNYEKNTCIYSSSVTIKIIGYRPEEDPDDPADSVYPDLHPAHNEKRSDAEGVPFNYSVLSVYSLFEVGLTYSDTHHARWIEPDYSGFCQRPTTQNPHLKIH